MIYKTNVDYGALLKRAYELYQLDWCREHDHKLEDWDQEHGFAGESFACIGEFETSEFEDRDYMEYLLSEEDFVLWNCWYYAPEIVVVLDGGVIQSVRSTNPYAKVFIADHDILENGPDEDEVRALDYAVDRGGMDDMHDVY